jgi:hypothetical protein
VRSEITGKTLADTGRDFGPRLTRLSTTKGGEEKSAEPAIMSIAARQSIAARLTDDSNLS